MAVSVLRRRFTVDEYCRMGGAGIFAEDDRVELIDGEVVEMTPIGPVHAAHVDRLNALFTAALGRRAIVRVQNPVRLDSHSEPVPDVAVLRPRPDFYATAHPGPADTVLVVEVSDTSLEFDRSVKLPLYARSGIPEVWILDAGAPSLEVHRDPWEAGYRERHVARRGERIALAAWPDVSLAVDDLLG